MRNTKSLFVRSLVLAFTASVAGCAAESEPAALGVDLSRYGIERVVADPADGGHLLLDAGGNSLGRVEYAVDGDAVALAIDLAGSHSRFTWSDDGATLQCGDGPVIAAGPDLPPVEGDPMAGCGDSYIVAALVAAADGVDIPGIEPQSDVQLRAACETISTTGGSCAWCRHFALSHSIYSEFAGGSCSQGWIVASCSYTFCSGGGSELEQSAQ